MVIGFCLAGCSNGSNDATTPPLPTVAWSHCDPEEQGVDSDGLVSLMNEIAAGDYGVHSLLVVRHGCVVLDADFFPYDGARQHDIASCTKSLTSLAVGVALKQGLISGVDDTLAKRFPGRTFDDPNKGAITLDDLLTMRSGLGCSSDTTTVLAMENAPDWIAYALGLPLASTPGTTWQYCSPNAHLLSGVVTSATGLAESAFLEQTLFKPIGVQPPIWPSDPQGLSEGWGDVRLRPEDLARLGLLLLHGGEWDGARLIDASWIGQSTRNHVGISGPLGGYGYLWWPTSGGYFAAGRGGQYLLVVPPLDLVVVATGAAGAPQLQAQTALFNEIVASTSAETPLPPNPKALAQLQGLLDAARKPPAPASVSTLPAASAWASGQRFQVGDNILGWTALTLTFGQPEAELRVVVRGAEKRASVGLDGVLRVTRGIDHFSTSPRYDDLDVALSGRWTNDTTFEITFDTIDRIDAGTFLFQFVNGQLKVTIHEKTWLDTDLTFSGTPG